MKKSNIIRCIIDAVLSVFMEKLINDDDVRLTVQTIKFGNEKFLSRATGPLCRHIPVVLFSHQLDGIWLGCRSKHLLLAGSENENILKTLMRICNAQTKRVCILSTKAWTRYQ